MKNSPQEYAQMLIDKYLIHAELWNCVDCYISATRCAIIDVTNTIDYIKTWGDTAEDDLRYYNEVLTILNSKL